MMDRRELAEKIFVAQHARMIVHPTKRPFALAEVACVQGINHQQNPSSASANGMVIVMSQLRKPNENS